MHSGHSYENTLRCLAKIDKGAIHAVMYNYCAAQCSLIIADTAVSLL